MKVHLNGWVQAVFIAIPFCVGDPPYAGLVRHPSVDDVRRVDIAHSGQTVPEALEQLEREIKSARQSGEEVLLVVHGFGASGEGGAIKAALGEELPSLARRYGFKAYGHADKDRVARLPNLDPRTLNPGSSLLVFPRRGEAGKESTQEFRPNFRNLRSKVRVKRSRRA